MPSRITAKVRLLDGETQEYAVQLKSHASNLITDVMKYLNVLEADYFGIQYSDKEDNLVFLDPSKRIDEQLKNTDNSLQFKFVVRFYPNSPCDLEEFTRYLIALQLKEDILNNQYKCTERNILVFMLAAIVQSIYGDYEQTECSRSDYIADMNILPTNIEDKKQILNEVRKKHMCFKEMTASESDSKLLDVACKLESYGLRFQPCKDKSGADVKLSVSYAGVVIYQGDTKKEFYTWPRIRKLAFKKNKLQLKLKHEQHPMKKGDVMEYAMSSRDTCKNIWRNCIEHYAFFRLDVQPKPKPKPIVFKRGSTFRYSGKTHKQLNDLVKHSNFKRQKFERYSVRRQRAAAADETGGAGDAKRLSDANSSTRGTNELDEGSFTLNEEQQNAQQQPTAAAETTTELSKIDEEKSNKHEENKTNDQAVPESKEQNGEEEDKTEAAAAQEEEEATTKKQNEEDWQVESGDLHSNTQKQQDAGGDQQQQRQRQQQQQQRSAKSAADVIMTSSHVRSSSIPSPATLHSSSGGHSDVTDDHVASEANMTSLSNGSGMDLMSTADLKSTTTSPSSGQHGDSQVSSLRRHSSSSVAYYVIKELLTTERTFCRDLDVLCSAFKMAVNEHNEKNRNQQNNIVVTSSPTRIIDDVISDEIFGTGDLLLEHHRRFLAKLEATIQQIDANRTRDLLIDDQYTEIEELIQDHITVVEGCRSNLEKSGKSIEVLEEICLKDARMENCYREFELHKVCYIPLGSFLLKPLQRIIHYKAILERLTRHYQEGGMTRKQYHLVGALHESTTICNSIQSPLTSALNYQKVAQLRRDLIGIDNLLSSNRVFVREGSLYKLSRKGFQQRLFFLFNDCLLYTSKGVTSTNQFKVHTSLPLNGMIIEINEGEKVVPNCFSIISSDKVVIVAASSQHEMNKWLEDFSFAISNITRDNDAADVTNYMSPLDKNFNLRDSQLSVHSSEDNNSMERKPAATNQQQRSNTTMHVCWHRNTSVSSTDHMAALYNQLSGYLLRKFKNSNGWQKLWVVFTNFCLFFYKSHHDQFPLASLPLLGYSVSAPAENDDIKKDFVFKLQFKTHVYFFRAESSYTFDRWMEVVSSTTSTSQRTRLFSRLDSNQPQ